jgi:hypothetical protein
MLLPNTSEYEKVCQYMTIFDINFHLKAAQDLPEEIPEAAAEQPGGLTIHNVSELLKDAKSTPAETVAYK